MIPHPEWMEKSAAIFIAAEVKNILDNDVALN
jgi:hypothetical protein